MIPTSNDRQLTVACLLAWTLSVAGFLRVRHHLHSTHDHSWIAFSSPVLVIFFWLISPSDIFFHRSLDDCLYSLHLFTPRHVFFRCNKGIAHSSPTTVLCSIKFVKGRLWNCPSRLTLTFPVGWLRFSSSVSLHIKPSGIEGARMTSFSPSCFTLCFAGWLRSLNGSISAYISCFLPFSSAFTIYFDLLWTQSCQNNDFRISTLNSSLKCRGMCVWNGNFKFTCKKPY